MLYDCYYQIPTPPLKPHMRTILRCITTHYRSRNKHLNNFANTTVQYIYPIMREQNTICGTVAVSQAATRED